MKVLNGRYKFCFLCVILGIEYNCLIHVDQKDKLVICGIATDRAMKKTDCVPSEITVLVNGTEAVKLLKFRSEAHCAEDTQNN